MRRLLALLLCLSVLALGDVRRSSQSRYDQPSRLVAIGDIHGDVEALISILKARNLVEWNGTTWKWIGGDTHVVFVGDLVDRGPDSRAVLDFLYNLESQAEKKGGTIHSLIGNHELMVLLGDRDYNSEIDQRRFKRYDPKQGFTEALRSYSSPYARDLRNRNTMLIIGDTLFVHAGLGKQMIKSMTPEKMDQMNQQVREWIAGYQKAKSEGRRAPKMSAEMKRYWRYEGPFWTRALAEEKIPKADVKGLLEVMGTKRIVIGHTFQENKPWIRELYDGLVLNLDTGNSSAMEGVLSAIEINDKKIKFYDDGKIPRLCPKYFKRLQSG